MSKTDHKRKRGEEKAMGKQKKRAMKYDVCAVCNVEKKKDDLFMNFDDQRACYGCLMGSIGVVHRYVYGGAMRVEVAYEEIMTSRFSMESGDNLITEVLPALAVFLEAFTAENMVCIGKDGKKRTTITALSMGEISDEEIMKLWRFADGTMCIMHPSDYEDEMGRKWDINEVLIRDVKLAELLTHVWMFFREMKHNKLSSPSIKARASTPHMDESDRRMDLDKTTSMISHANRILAYGALHDIPGFIN